MFVCVVVFCGLGCCVLFALFWHLASLMHSVGSLFLQELNVLFLRHTTVFGIQTASRRTPCDMSALCVCCDTYTTCTRPECVYDPFFFKCVLLCLRFKEVCWIQTIVN